MIVWPWWDDSVELPKLVFSWCSLGLAGLLCLISPPLPSCSPAKTLASVKWLSGGIACYVLLFWLLGNADGWDSVLRLVNIFVAGLSVGALVDFEPAQIRRLAGAATTGWLLTASYSWIQRLGLDPIPWSRPDLSQVRTISGLGNPNHMGLHVALLAPVALNWLVLRRSQSTGRRCLGALLWSLATSVIWFSGTRASMLALVASVSLFGLLLLRKAPGQLRWLFGALAGLALVVVMWFLTPSSQQNQFQSWQRVASIAARPDESSQTRLILWRVAARQIVSAPIGQGAGWFGFHYLFQREPEPESLRVANRRPEHPHNFFLEQQLDGGPIALLGWLLALGIAFRTALRHGLSDSEEAVQDAMAAACSLVALAINLCFISLNFASGLAVVWILLLSSSSEAKERSQPSAWFQGWVARFVLFGLSIGGFSLAAATCHRESLSWAADDVIYSYRNAPQVTPAPQAAVQRALDYCIQAEFTALPWSQKRQIHQLAELYGFGCFSFQANHDARFGKLDERAVFYYTQACQLYPYDAYLWSGLGRYLEGNLTEQRLETITAAYNKAHSLDPFNLAFALDLSRWHWRLGKYAESLQVCQDALSKAPHSESAQVHQALCFHSLGRQAEAEAAWTEILKLHQGEPLKKPW
jgi:O-antigen ligase